MGLVVIQVGVARLVILGNVHVLDTALLTTSLMSLKDVKQASQVQTNIPQDSQLQFIACTLLYQLFVVFNFLFKL